MITVITVSVEYGDVECGDYHGFKGQLLTC